jgi:hypothetical protein
MWFGGGVILPPFYRRKMMITREKQEQIYDDWFHKVGDLNVKYSHSIDKLDVIKASSIFKLLECSPKECISMYELMSQNYYTFREFRTIIGAILDFDRQYVFREYLSHGLDRDLVLNDREDYVLWHYDEIDFDVDF